MMRDDHVGALDAHLQRCAALPFDYVQMDCARFVGEWVRTATGVDHLGMISWNSEAAARKWLNSNGLSSLPAAVDQFLPSISVARAGVGDVVAVSGTPGDLSWTPLGICLGRYSAFLVPDVGIVRLRTLSAIRAWSVF